MPGYVFSNFGYEIVNLICFIHNSLHALLTFIPSMLLK